MVFRIIDISGKVVDELQLGKQEKGVHLVDWNASSLVSGTYFIQLKDAPNVYKKVFVAR